jgi:hypothetical protein
VTGGSKLRRSKSAGFLAIGLGLLLIVAAAVLPVSPATERFGPFRVNLGTANCGPAGYVAFHIPQTECGNAAYRRLLSTTPVGLLIVALGMALFAGGDQRRGSRVEVSTPRVNRGRRVRSRGSRRYTPG